MLLVMCNEQLGQTETDSLYCSTFPNKAVYSDAVKTPRQLCSRWHPRDHFPRDNVVSQGETSIIFGIDLITHRFHNKGMVIGG